MTYSSTAKAFVDASNNNNYLFVENDGNGAARWFYGTDAEGGTNPRGQVPSLTFNVIRYGTYDSQTGTVAYDTDSYRIRLERDSSGAHVANAYIV
jgi:hypothetical protein